jgi:arabinogalactan endo-1,4-beta-galactosidase
MNYLRILFLTTLFALPLSTWSQPVLGADLSYVNELEDCGAIFYADGDTVDVFDLFGHAGCNLARFRLWHTPDWTDFCNDTNRFSNLNDVRLSISRAKAAGMEVLLDFHYSDNWADPGKQYMPEAWRSISDLEVLKDSVYQYTYTILSQLASENLFPEYVQLGNEINNGFVDPTPQTSGMNWSRTAALLGEAALAARAAAADNQTAVQLMLHAAQPQHASWWFGTAQTNGITDYDIIGISYYTKWSNYDLTQVGNKVAELKNQFQKPVWIVETAYPYSLTNFDQGGHIWNSNGDLLSGYPATPTGQRQFMIDLTESVLANGGAGVVYWEPAWISSNCCTQWNQGSAWENVGFFDHSINPIDTLGVFDFFSYPYSAINSLELNHTPLGWKLSPNPGSHSLKIEAPLVLKEAVQIRIFDLQGRSVFFREANPGEFPLSLGLEELTSGVYQVQIRYQDKLDSLKWQKE